MTNTKADIVREYGPFEGVEGVHGVTYDGEHVWFCCRRPARTPSIPRAAR